MATILQYGMYGQKERSFINISRRIDKIEFYYQFRKHVSISQLFVVHAMLNFLKYYKIWGNIIKFLLSMSSTISGCFNFFLVVTHPQFSLN